MTTHAVDYNYLWVHYLASFPRSLANSKIKFDKNIFFSSGEVLGFEIMLNTGS